MNRLVWWKREEKEKEKEVKYDDAEEEILLHSSILTIDNYADKNEKDEKEREEKKQKEEYRKRDEKKREDKKRDSTFGYCIDGLIMYLERCKLNLS